MQPIHIRLHPQTADSVLQLIIALQEHLAGLEVYDCIELVTDNPDLECVINTLFRDYTAPAAAQPPAPKAPRKARRSAVAPTEAAPLPAPLPAVIPPKPPAEDGDQQQGQVMRWRILASGKEVNAVSKLLALRTGELLHNRENGLYEVYETVENKLAVRRVRAAGNGHQPAEQITDDSEQGGES